MEKSIWQKDLSKKVYKSISSDLECDILIIGGGMTGISTCYNLINKNKKIIMIDSGKFIGGVTSRSTGKITYLQDLKYQDIYNNYGIEEAKLYYESQKQATKIILNNIKDNNIDCDLEKVSSVTFTFDEKENVKFRIEENILNKLNIKYYKEFSEILHDNIKNLIMVKNTYVFNPVKYLNELKKKITSDKNIGLFENSMAKKIEKKDSYYEVLVNNNTIKTNKIVLACNYPFFTIPGFIPFKTYLEKSYITATKVDNEERISAITSNYPYISYRYHKDFNDKYFIYLSNSSKICDKLNYEENYLMTVLASKEITKKVPFYKWTNMDLMTNDSLPIIGKLIGNDDSIYIGTGYNTWGMTNGTIAGKIISELICGKKNKYEDLFSPQRSLILKPFKNFVSKTVLSNSKAYILNMIKKNLSWYNSNPVIIYYNGKRIGIYVDKYGISHKVSNICPHLKCFLTFNKVDETWDCPCHGSRFDIDGNVIKGPSVKDIKIPDIK